MRSDLCAGSYTLRAIFSPLEAYIGPNRHSIEGWILGPSPFSLPSLPECLEEEFCELPLYGVLRGWSGWSCNSFDFLASNSLSRAFAESNQAAKRPL
jgi:hypothetical protein